MLKRDVKSIVGQPDVGGQVGLHRCVVVVVAEVGEEGLLRPDPLGFLDRLVERGVRFVSIFTGNQTWDHHSSILKSLPAACKQVDQPAAALVMDLKQRGLLDTTIVHWGGEMGRLPVIQNRAGAKGRESVGRDHNTYGFSMWVAGGGFKAGHAHGATDEFGHHAVKDVVNHYDYHATVLHLLGLDTKKLSYKRNGVEQVLVENPQARVVTGLLA